MAANPAGPESETETETASTRLMLAIERGFVRSAESLARHYYGLRVRLPYFAGGYFWWYYAEDSRRGPMRRTLGQGLRAEASSWRRR